jgi:hypothetical protein
MGNRVPDAFRSECDLHVRFKADGVPGCEGEFLTSLMAYGKFFSTHVATD